MKYKLFRSYCSSIYGCELWHLGGGKVNDFCTAWCKGLRRIWNLPYRTHSDILQSLSDDVPVFDEICKHCL